MLPRPSCFYAIEVACLFIVVSSPLAYRATDAVLGRYLLETRTRGGDATVFGVVLHALIFAGIAFLLLRAGP